MNNPEEIFYSALELSDPDAITAYLDEICANNKALRTQVEALLALHEEAGDFLETPSYQSDIALRPVPVSEGPGTVIGPYKLLEKIGEGGMAVVYMAEQQRPLQRKVALKLVKLGMDSEQVIARFEAERQALALMDHPNIARVFDAGTTESGRPYFVMELVKGVSITDFCDKNQMNTQDRLDLFVNVCQAVQHAHQKGIIHRDLKPSNVMVTFHDSKPVPKVIDFGIAKATNRRLTEKTLFTQYAQIIGTPEYMSPEQAQMTDQDVDTRSDVYSLGVLLYELLTGKPPFDAAYLRSKSYAEIQRIIREEQPTKPSTKISALGEAMVEIADKRHTNPEALRRLIRTDLDWIVMKTLEKDRTRRYASVSEFTSDIQRHLDHEPVLAGPPSTWYCIKKYVQRHRSLVVSLAAVGLTVMIGLAVSSYLYTRVGDLKAQMEIDQGLTRVEDMHTRGMYRDALEEIEPFVQDGTDDFETRLLYAKILVDLNLFDQAMGPLESLTTAETSISGTAHYLLSRIMRKSDPNQAQWHRDESSKLLPDTADTYILHAWEAENSTEALEWLDKAVKQDPGHYTAREVRALVHSGLRDYINVKHDAGVLVGLRPKNYMGYALRGVAHRELGDLENALSDLNNAIELCDIERERPVLLENRQETYWRSGNYLAAIEDIQRCIDLVPDPGNRFYRVTLAKILYALKQYNQVKEEFDILRQTVVELYWLATMSCYISDTISAGKSFELPDNLLPVWPSLFVSPSFYLPAVANLYRTLYPRATRLVRGSYYVSSWSPDGRQLAYTRSNRWNWDSKSRGLTRPNNWMGNVRGIEVLDLESRDTRLLVKSGDGPAWSPDGRFIAYRDKEEIRLIPAGGGSPIHLGQGHSYGWTDHPTRLYVHSAEDEMVYYIDVNDPDLSRVQVTPCSERYAKVSPDERYLAHSSAGVLTVTELAFGTQIVKWVLPATFASELIRWSPNSKEISIGIGGFSQWSSGLWIFNMELNEGRHLLDPVAVSCNWSPDGSKVALDLSYPAGEIWLAEMDPNRPTWESLGIGETRGEYIRRTWQNHIELLQLDDLPDYFRRTMVNNLCTLGINQFECGEYEDALWTLQHVATIERTPASWCVMKTLAYTVMALDKLERMEEARDTLRLLRSHFAQNNDPSEDYLYMAEQTLLAEDSALVPLWDHLQGKQYDAALKFLDEGIFLRPAQSLIEKETLQSARIALARAYCQSALAARHEDRFHEENLCYEKALRANPNGQLQQEMSTRLALYQQDQHQSVETVSPLVAWWPITEVDTDSIHNAAGSGLQGTFVGDAATVVDRDRGPVLALDGKGDRVDFETDTRLNLSDKITVSLWIRVKAFGNRRHQRIMRGNWSLVRRGSGRTLDFAHQELVAQSGEEGVSLGHIPVDDGRWHHVTAVYDGLTIYQYIDGKLDYHTRTIGRIMTHDSTLRMGATSDRTNPIMPQIEWNGWIDDVRIYREALSQTQIKALYEGRDPFSN
jgi:serine/threonine protein kinase